jgi:hypothetical protein
MIIRISLNAVKRRASNIFRSISNSAGCSSIVARATSTEQGTRTRPSGARIMTPAATVTMDGGA